MKATEFKTIAKGAASNQLAQAFPTAKPESEPACNPQRIAYQGEISFPPTDPSAVTRGEAG